MPEAYDNSLDERSAAKLLPLAIGLVGLLVYANTFGAAFVWDDASSVLLHRHVQNPAQVLELFKEDQHAFGRGQGNFYRPFVALSFMVDFAMAYDGGPIDGGIPDVSPFFFHLSSLGWHILAAMSLLWLMSRLGASLAVKALVTLIYTAHPLHTEAVAYISGRADSMSAAFMFAGIAFATWDESTRRRVGGMVLSALCCIGALLSKESSLIFPALLSLCLVCRYLQTPTTGFTAVALRFAPAGIAVALTGIYIGLRATVLSFGEASEAAVSSFMIRLGETLQSFALYIALMFVPTNLHMERTLANTSILMSVAGLILFAGCIGLLAYGLARKQYRISLGMAWFLLTWLPISGLYPLNAPMAEHWMYVPMAGFFWALAELLVPLARVHPWAYSAAKAGAFVWLAFLVGVAVDRNLDWRDDETLFNATLRENPDSLRVRYNLAVVYEDILKNPTGAKREYTQLLKTYKKLEDADPEKARANALTALESRISLGNLYLRLQEINNALTQFGDAREMAATEEMNLGRAEACIGLGQCYLSGGDHRQAAEFFREAANLRPDLAPLIERIFPGALGAP